MLYYALTHLEKPPSEGAGGAGRLLVVLVGVEQVRDRNCQLIKGLLPFVLYQYLQSCHLTFEKKLCQMQREMDLRCTCLILAGVLVLLGCPVTVRLGHPLGDLGRGEEGELLDGSARPVLGVLGLQHLRAYTSRGQDSGKYATFSQLYKQKGALMRLVPRRRVRRGWPSSGARTSCVDWSEVSSETVGATAAV